MAASGFEVARNDLARVFLFDNGVFRCGECGEFLNCVSVDALAQDRGDITRIECPSPTRYGEFDEVGTIPGEISRLTTTLSSRMSRTEISRFYNLFRTGCSFDLHLHFGLCQDPSAFYQFDKALVFEDVQVTSFGTDPLIAIQSSDRAVINETIDISVGNYYELVNLIYSERADSETTAGPIVAVSVCDRFSCGGECGDPSDGCQRLFAVSDDGQMYYSEDKGYNWQVIAVADDLANVPTGLVDLTCWGDYVVALGDANDFWYINRDELFLGTATTFNMVTGVLPAGATAMATWRSMFGVIVGAGGNVALFTDFEMGSEVVDAGFATTEDLNDVEIGPDGTAVAVGANGVVIYSYDHGETWHESLNPVTGNPTNTAVLVKSKKNWLVGTDDGQLWCTDDAGCTWERVKYCGWAQNTDAIEDLSLSTCHVLYMVTSDELQRSLNGGCSWICEPNSKAEFTTNTGLQAVAACIDDPNFVLVGGADIAGTGLLVTGIPN